MPSGVSQGFAAPKGVAGADGSKATLAKSGMPLIPRFLKLTASFDQSLQVPLIDRIVEAFVLHRPGQSPNPARGQPPDKTLGADPQCETVKKGPKHSSLSSTFGGRQ
jgi:hypothetical protein